MEACKGPRARGDASREWIRVAGLLRIEFESTPPREMEERRELGGRIDRAADQGLAAITELPESSLRLRFEADLLGTMIRSSFRASKYLDRMRAAAERSLALDPENARAWVTAAKPLVFAGRGQGRDLGRPLELLDRAVALQPSLESALLLRAHARGQRGDEAGERADLQRVLDLNPDCVPARRRLAE